MPHNRFHTFIYALITTLVATLLYIQIRNSGILPETFTLSAEALKTHIKSLSGVNFIWLLGLPGIIGLILFKRHSDYLRFFFKMFRLIMIFMAIPVGVGIWGALTAETHWSIKLMIFFAVWIILSLTGAFMMTQKEYIFGDYKKDTAWRHKIRPEKTKQHDR